MATQTSISEKKILILISQGGGGHKSAGDSLREILSPYYTVEVKNALSTALKPLDPLSSLSFGYFKGEELYNYLLKHHHTRLIHWMAKLGAKHLSCSKIEKSFEKYLQSQETPPDLIISTTPFINSGIAKVTNRWQIPFLILPTDLDGSTFFSGFPSNPLYSQLKVGLAYADPDIKSITFKKAKIPLEQSTITGFPIRPGCLKTYTAEEKKQLLEKYNLSPHYPIVTLMMGALGGDLIFAHTKRLTHLNAKPIQYNICVGHNKKAAHKIRHYLTSLKAEYLSENLFKLSTGSLFYIRGFTKEIIELMALSDVIITKTGSCTVNEAIYLEKKLLLDNTDRSTARHLWWEKFNIPFVEKYGLGKSFTDPKEMGPLLFKLLEKSDVKTTLKRPDFKKNILLLIEKMLLSEPIP